MPHDRGISVGSYVAVRGWLECDDRQLDRIRQIVASGRGGRNGAGWAFPDVSGGWTNYAFFGADILDTDVASFLDQLRAIAAAPARLPGEAGHPAGTDEDDVDDLEDLDVLDDLDDDEDEDEDLDHDVLDDEVAAIDHVVIDADEIDLVTIDDDADDGPLDDDHEDGDHEDGDPVVGFFLATPEDDVTGAVEWRVRDGRVETVPAGERFRYLDE
ncbi:hypothetical protein [Streptoalloteichus tenebrarius]|uniref:hypothetical protein n=1 Tax=Streptoalloteichus tenebrarius (strain ATCC 17920 / DSM 40477 / JCM 4838 / CBS 697.72 / NBRC 16177 / NCIMB 11028 / NRRL B-12390 / A12253. 1 / ISP 5477) TaxID=1933 RepID=UPI0020A4A7D9|nr:hypothetical protein [Streptoalloteichus tenebrarius]